MLHRRYIAVVAIAIWLTVPSTQAQYVSSTTEQVSADVISPGTFDNPIIRIRIVVGPTPIELYALFVSTEGSTDPDADIAQVKFYGTGSSTVFSTAAPYLQDVIMLPSGTNYFWVTFDLRPDALACDTLDAECSTVYATDGTQTPTVTSPPGYALITSCTTGIVSVPGTRIELFPNPSSGVFTINTAHDAFMIHDQQGRLVMMATDPRRSRVLVLDGLVPGCYILSLVQGDRTSHVQLVIDKN